MLARLDQKPVFVRGGLKVPNQGLYVERGAAFFYTRQGVLQLLRVDGFEQVVYGVYFECLYRILVEGRGKNHRRR